MQLVPSLYVITKTIFYILSSLHKETKTIYKTENPKIPEINIDIHLQ